MLFKAGLYNSAPLKKFLKSEFSSVTSMKRSVNVGIVDLLSGKWADFNEDNIAQDNNLLDVMYTSLSTTPYFSPVEAFGSYYFDGSAIWDIDIPSAVNKCAQKGYAQSDIVVDVVMTSGATLEVKDTSDYNSIEMGLRFLKIAQYYGTMDGLMRAKFAYPAVNFRYVVGPSADLPKERNPLEMNAADMQAMFTMGA